MLRQPAIRSSSFSNIQSILTSKFLHRPNYWHPGTLTRTCTIYTRSNPSTASTTRREPFRILFMGRDEFSCLVFEQLIAAKDVYERIWVATNPDERIGRGRKELSVSPLKLAAERCNVHVQYIPRDRPAFKKWFPSPPFLPTAHETAPNPNHLIITASFGRILPAHILQLFPATQRLNVHPSLLPAYRGPAPIQHAIWKGEKETGVCVLEMLETKKGKGIDAGDVWAMERMPIPEDVPFGPLHDGLARQGGRLLVSVLRDMLAGKAKSIPQGDATGFPHAPLITPQDAILNFKTMDASEILRMHRAIGHQRPLITYLPSGKSVQLLALSVHTPPSPPSSNLIPHHLHTAQTDLSIGYYHPPTQTLLIPCARGTVLRVTRVKQQDRKELEVKEWWNGVQGGMKARAEVHVEGKRILWEGVKLGMGVDV